MTVNLDSYEYSQSEADALSIKDCAVALYNPAPLKPFNTPQAGGWRKADTFGEFGVRHPPFCLQYLENSTVEVIQTL
ncbi:protein of unknown function [Candidatus Filomicrobium marinum]|uniref:Uncharacterized protein n=1 Tax=Candidatus Filomicrobium marinum TaxID=1608628 RepID=A0A0D6JHG9_9HYPH|nr:protein of unknown function [Candidatus Filomicrobium marinum]